MVLRFRDTTPPPADRRAARARRVRAWAWPVRLALLACLGVAVWQEPRLSPWLHARMQVAAAGGGPSSDKGAGVAGWIAEALSP